jgi:cyclopropane-fatty-acyl-phospholipid synthase
MKPDFQLLPAAERGGDLVGASGSRCDGTDVPLLPSAGVDQVHTRVARRANLRALGVARRIVAELFGAPAARWFAVRYWSGPEEAGGGKNPPRFTLILRHPAALIRMLLPPTEMRIAEAFLRDDFEIEGDLEAAAGLAAPLAERLRSPGRLLRLALLLVRLPRGDGAVGEASQPGDATRHWRPWRRVAAGRRHTRVRDSQAIKHHYDVGNDFYSLWLDDDLAYSCGYFPTGNEDLAQAQEAKFELICRKLRLRPGERLLDIGCGWGGLIRYAVRRYGVTALGITLSEAQAALARERIARDGLDDRCTVEVRDYRDLPRDLTFDKVASVGMFEHVGRARLDAYFAEAMRLTRPGGLFLNHGIISLDDARARQGAAVPLRRLWGMGRFMDRYVFPDGELVSLATVVAGAEAAGFETRDVESLREHYAETLRLWVRRLERRSSEARALVGEKTYRVWRLYMAASAHAFRTARIGIAQVLLARPTADGACCLPRTRADLYGR